MKKYNAINFRRKLAMAATLVLPLLSFAQEETAQPTISYFSNSLFNTLLIAIILLAIMVITLSSALKNLTGSDMFMDKLKKDKEQKPENSSKIVGLTLFFLLTNFAVFSQDKLSPVLKNDRIGGLDYFTFYIMVVTIALELLVLGIMFNIFKNILGANKKVVKVSSEVKPKTKTILDKLNDTVDIDEEETIMLDHNYDGIKELDNNLPPWWKYGFYLTIVIAIFYLINYHITKTAPLQGEEYTNSVKKAEAEIAEYMKTSANNVDESTVKILTDQSDLNAGKDIFIATCSACHGQYGEGTVGPNLTDDYWIHSGSIVDIFKTVKYGWPDKGMKSWKEDLSPMQIAQVSSYIKTLNGTHPPKPKEKQGELYIEQTMPSDSTAVKADSTTVIKADTIKKLVSGLPKQ